MKLYVGADHAGFALKQELVAHAKAQGHEVVDLGPPSADRVDYPDFAVKVSQAVAAEKAARGLLVCGTGIGMSIAANKVPGIRAAVVWNVESAKLASEHNAANVLAIGARQFAALGYDLALCARRTDRLEELKAGIADAHPGRRVEVRALDVTDDDAVFEVFRAFQGDFRTIDKVVVNAMLAERSGRNADSYGSLGSLMYGAVVREAVRRES